jgi:hypothetical protein
VPAGVLGQIEHPVTNPSPNRHIPFFSTPYPRCGSRIPQGDLE